MQYRHSNVDIEDKFSGTSLSTAKHMEWTCKDQTKAKNECHNTTDPKNVIYFPIVNLLELAEREDYSILSI